MKIISCALALIVQGLTAGFLPGQAGIETKSFAVQPGDTLAINSDFGSIRIRPWDGAGLQASIQKSVSNTAGKSSPDVSFRKSGTTLFINTTFSGTPGESVVLDVLAPKFINVTISGASPAVDIAGIQGVVRVQNSTGSINAENLTSTASLITDSGDIRFKSDVQPQGDVRLESTSGNINCELVDSLNLRSMIRAGGKLFWDMDPTVEGASVEKQLGTSGPLLYAGNLKGNVIVRLKPGFGPKPAAVASQTPPAKEPVVTKPEPVQSPVPQAPIPSAEAQRPELRRNAGGRNTQASNSSPRSSDQQKAEPPAAAPASVPAPPPSVPAREASASPPSTRDTRQETSPKGTQQPPIVQGTYDLKVNVDSVFLNVSVRDRTTNRSVVGLKKEDFLIYEDGVRQEIDQLLPTEAPFNLLLLLDVSGSTQSYIHLMQEAAVDFTKQIKTNDKIAVATFNSTVQLVQNFTNDRAAAEKAIRRIKSGGGTAFYDALMTCLDRYMRGIEGRSAIVVFTDGVDNQLEGRPGQGSRTRYEDLYRRVQESDTIIYTIFLDTEGQVAAARRSPGGYPGGYPGGRRRGGFGLPFPLPIPAPQPTPTPYPRRQADERAIYEEASKQLQEIADETGGRMYTPHKASELSGVYSEIADDLRIQYLLAYNSTNRAQDGRWRQIRVDVQDRPEAVVRARKGYYARKELTQ
jgi:VWFA-related protein